MENKLKKVDYKIIITAIISLSIMEIAAMHYGINGTMRTIIFAMIAGLAGLSMPKIIK